MHFSHVFHAAIGLLVIKGRPRLTSTALFRRSRLLEVEEVDSPQMREDRDGGNSQRDACGAPRHPAIGGRLVASQATAGLGIGVDTDVCSPSAVREVSAGLCARSSRNSKVLMPCLLIAIGRHPLEGRPIGRQLLQRRNVRPGSARSLAWTALGSPCAAVAPALSSPRADGAPDQPQVAVHPGERVSP